MSVNRFVHLRVHSAYSLLEGAIHPKALVKLCVEHDMPAVAVTDTGNLFGALEFSLAAAESGVQPIIGSLLYVEGEVPEGVHALEPPVDILPVLAKDEQGYYNLLQLSSRAHLETVDGGRPRISWEKLSHYSDGLIAFTGGMHGMLGRLLLEGQAVAAEKALLKLKELFGDRLYIELMRHGLEQEQRIESTLMEFSTQYQVPLVATNDVFFASKDMYEAHDALRCIAQGTYVEEQNRERLTVEHYFKSSNDMVALFADCPDAIENTLEIAKRCAVLSPVRKPILPSFTTEEGRDEVDELRAVAEAGLQMRLDKYVFQATEERRNMDAAAREVLSSEYRERLAYELDVITQMGFPGYFLIVSDFIRWSKRHGIPVGPGRGSGAGSVVAWVLEITDLDPLQFGLLFERFLNPERVSMPDFDVDFCQYRRDEVIRYVQERYGAEQVAQIITFGKLQARAVLRDVGRVLQMPYGQVDRICKMVPNNPAQPVTLAEAIDIEPDLRRARDEDSDVKRLLSMGLQLEGLYRHASTHAAGVVIGDRPLYELIPMYRDPRSDMPVTQFSMKYAEMAGLVKFDFLGLKTLTTIKQAVDLVRSRNIDLDISTIPLDDEPTYAMLGRGESVGVFQLESSGMRDTLYKMKPDRLEELIALISLYRPGPMDNIPTYIACKQGDQEPDYLHPKLEHILTETYGVIIYQEQVMQIAQVLSGYTLGGADLLRRAMGKKIQAEMDKQRKLFVDGAVDNSVDKNQADGIFDLVAKFAGYGFNKSHAAAYALISYQTGYLKSNYPVEFMVATMNLDIHDTDKLQIFKEEAIRMGITILSPDVNKSMAQFSIELNEQGEQCIRYALGALKNVGEAAIDVMVKEREVSGAFASVFDWAKRCDSKVVNKRQLESLVKAGAFDGIYSSRRELFEGVEVITRYAAAQARERDSAQESLFGDASGVSEAVPHISVVEDWSFQDRLMVEYEAVGFFLTSHPLDNYHDSLAQLGIVASVDVAEASKRKTVLKLAGIVTGKRIRNSPKGKYAFLQVSDSSSVFEVSVFDEELLNHAKEWLDDVKPLVFDVDVRHDDSGGVRMITTGIFRLDQYVERQRFSMCVTLEHVDNLSALKTLFVQHPKGRTSLSLLVPVGEGRLVKVVLPGQYGVTPVDARDIGGINGVVDVSASS